VLEVIHISDTHFGPHRRHEIRGVNACDRARAMVDAIEDLPFRPDFVVHTGDVVNDPDPAAYALAREVLSGLSAPVYFATGNHDDAVMMREALEFGPLRPLLPGVEDRLCYRIEAKRDGMACYVVDGKVPEEEGPHGFLPADQLEAVLDDAGEDAAVAVFLHYPLAPIGSKWIDAHLPLANGSEVLGALTDRLGGRLRGIFFGHLHRGVQIYRDGVLQSGVSSPACEFSAGPDDECCDYLADGAIPFHHLTLSADATAVKSYALPFPAGR